MNLEVQRPQFWNEIRVLLLSAMTIFVYTIGIGILNGMDVVDFDQRRLLGHVHGGTLGWLTLSVFAAALWLFGEGRRPGERERTVVRALCVVAVVTFATYVAVFSTTYGEVRPAVGAVAVLAITGLLVWVVWRARHVPLGVPHLGFLAAIATSVTGGLFGVLLGLQIATGTRYLPEGGEDVHPATMVLGFLTPIAFAMSEWAFRFPNPPRADRPGVVQMVFLFVAGAVMSLAFLLSADWLTPVALLLLISAIVIFFRRMWPDFRRVDWLAPGPERYAVLAAGYLVFVLLLLFYFTVRYQGDFDAVPVHEGLALDHSQFIGAVTSGVFAMLLSATLPDRRGRTIDQLVFVLVEVGLVGFAAGLFFDVTEMKRVFAPTMGTGLLLGLGTFAWRLVPVVREDVAVERGVPASSRG